MTKVLVVGGGGREHAIVRALLRSPRAPELHAAPGNPGIAADATVHPVAADDVDGLVSLGRELAVDLVVVGPEVPLVDGLVDALGAEGIAAFGPSAGAARLEGSKAYAKEVMLAAGVPTAGHATVTSVADGMAAIDRYPVVLKYDGLAAGKGVVIAPDEASARATLGDMLEDHHFGDAAVVVEEHLVGEEVSLLAVCDGERAVALAPAQDYKRIGDGDVGPNTGGMGAYSPVVHLDAERTAQIAADVHAPIVDELARRGAPFHGILYAGLMMTGEGPKVLEYNVRFGDPETQAVLPRLRSDLLELMEASVRPGGLADVRLEWDPRWAVTVVLAAAGYPGRASRGDVIEGADGAKPTPGPLAPPATGAEVTHAGAGADEAHAGAGVAPHPAGAAVELTHAGTARDDDGRLVTAGGRVMNVTALGDSPGAARDAAYAVADRVRFAGRQMRGDIALVAVERAG